MEPIVPVFRTVLGFAVTGFLFTLAAGRRRSKPAATSAATDPARRRGGLLMIRPEPSVPGLTRVIGSLTGDAIQVLVQAVDGGARVLDLSEVDQADTDAVVVLADLERDRCTFVACPRWLELWIEQVGRDSKGVRA
jgi:hypothetical protein